MILTAQEREQTGPESVTSEHGILVRRTLGTKTVKVSARKQVEPGKVPRTLPEIMAAYEKMIILQALKHNGFSRAKTATSLGVRRALLWRRMKLLRIDHTVVPKGHGGRPRKKVPYQFEEFHEQL